MSRRRDVGSITVAIPIDAVLAVRSSARMSRDGISDDYEGYRHKGRDYEDLARRRAAEMAELDELLAQLGDDEEQAREITGDYDTLHGVLGDVLLEAIRHLAVHAGNYWRHEGTIGDIDRQIAEVQRRLVLLREAERAADDLRAADHDDDGTVPDTRCRVDCRSGARRVVPRVGRRRPGQRQKSTGSACRRRVKTDPPPPREN